MNHQDSYHTYLIVFIDSKVCTVTSRSPQRALEKARSAYIRRPVQILVASGDDGWQELRGVL